MEISLVIQIILGVGILAGLAFMWHSVKITKEAHEVRKHGFYLDNSVRAGRYFVYGLVLALLCGTILFNLLF